MNGFTFKAARLAFVLLATAYLPALSSASSTENDPKIYSAKLGCMACHQGEIRQPNKAVKKSQAKLRRKNQAQNVEAG